VLDRITVSTLDLVSQSEASVSRHDGGNCGIYGIVRPHREEVGGHAGSFQQLYTPRCSDRGVLFGKLPSACENSEGSMGIDLDGLNPETPGGLPGLKSGGHPPWTRFARLRSDPGHPVTALFPESDLSATSWSELRGEIEVFEMARIALLVGSVDRHPCVQVDLGQHVPEVVRRKHFRQRHDAVFGQTHQVKGALAEIQADGEGAPHAHSLSEESVLNRHVCAAPLQRHTRLRE